jgi:hypothetical protein
MRFTAIVPVFDNSMELNGGDFGPDGTVWAMNFQTTSIPLLAEWKPARRK